MLVCSLLSASGCLDLESLCIVPEKRCWVLYLDIVVSDGARCCSDR